jgi:hypothetical protein
MIGDVHIPLLHGHWPRLTATHLNNLHSLGEVRKRNISFDYTAKRHDYEWIGGKSMQYNSTTGGIKLSRVKVKSSRVELNSENESTSGGNGSNVNASCHDW